MPRARSRRRRIMSDLGSEFFVDQTNGNDASDGRFAGTAWQTASKFNGETFRNKDRVLLKRDELWREQWTIPSSGAPGHRITLGAYGPGADPIIDGSVQVTGPWNDEGGNVWSATYNIDPLGIVIIDGAVGTLVADAGSVNDPGEFFWGANTLYVYSIGAPASVYAANKTYGILATSRSHLILDGLHIRYARNNGIRLATSGAGRIVRNCTVEYNAEQGFNAFGDGSATNDIYHNNDVSYNQECGLIINDMQNVEVHHNDLYENWTRTAVQGDQLRCILIPAGLSIHHNWILRPATTNNNDGIDLANDCDGARVFYNVVQGNFTAKNNTENYVVYNNVFYDVHADLTAVIYLDGGAPNGTLRNNIVWSRKAGGYAIMVGPNSEPGFDSDYNDLFAPAGHAGYFSGANQTTIANWRTATGGDANSQNADPSFVNAAAEDFHLLVGSVCRNAGTGVGLGQDYEGTLVPQEANPAIGAYEYVA